MTEIRIEGAELLCCYWHHYECDGTAEKAFIKWLPGMFPTPLQSLAEVYSCKRGLLWRKCSLNDCTILYFSGIKRFREHIETTTYDVLLTAYLARNYSLIESNVIRMLLALIKHK